MHAIDTTLSALSDPTRRQVVELLREQPARASQLASAVGTSRPAMSRHLRVLRRCGMVIAEELEHDARARVYRLQPEPFRALSDWVRHVEGLWDDQLHAFKAYVEEP